MEECLQHQDHGCIMSSPALGSWSRNRKTASKSRCRRWEDVSKEAAFLHTGTVLSFLGRRLRSTDFVYTVWYQTKKVVSALNIYFLKLAPSFLRGEHRGGKAKKRSEGGTKWAGRELTARQDWQERREAGEVVRGALREFGLDFLALWRDSEYIKAN